MQQTPAAITVHVPGPAQGRPRWKSVAVIASLGFVVGVVWPRLAGVRLGPSLPEAPSASLSSSASPATPSAPSAPLPSASLPSAPASAPPLPAGAGPAP